MLKSFARCRHRGDAAGPVRRPAARLERVDAGFAIDARALSGASAE